VEALAIGETVEISEKIDSEQNFLIFSDSASLLGEISSSSTMSNTSQITQMLKDKIQRLESRRNEIQFYCILGEGGVKVNESCLGGIDSQIFLPMADLKAKWKNKGKEELHCFCQDIKCDREQSYFERYYKNVLSPWFREKKWIVVPLYQ
jgi:hypothetical protein